MKSKLLSHADARNVFRLVGECRELGDDYRIWRAHALAGLARLVDSDLVLHASLTGVLHHRTAMHDGSAWGFENGFNFKGWMHVLEEYGVSLQSDLLVEMLRIVRDNPGDGVTRARQSLIRNHDWERSFDNEVIARTLGTDPVMQSQHWASGHTQTLDAITISRGRGGRLFSDREVAIVDWVHGEIASLIGGSLADLQDPEPSKLTPRLRQTLHCLLQGDSDKQIATRLHLSTHTVNQYTKSIYSFFHVSGRAELLSRWVKRGWKSNPNEWNLSYNLVPY